MYSHLNYHTESGPTTAGEILNFALIWLWLHAHWL